MTSVSAGNVPLVTTAPLPDSGDPGGRPPRADTLPSPALWPPREGAEAPFDRLRDEDVPSRDPVSVGGAWAAAGLMLVGAVLLGVAVVLASVWLAVASVVIGLAGLVLGWRVKIFAAVQLGTAKERDGQQARQAGGPATP